MAIKAIRKYAMVALSLMGSAILLFSCGNAEATTEGVNNETLMTERSENLSILMSENGRRSYHFKTPLLEGYTLAADPYREFRKGIRITTYQSDSLSTVNAVLVANYAIYYENRELWEAKGDVVVEKADGTKLYTQQLFWNSKTGRIYSNVDSKIVKGTDVFMGEGFESDEELKEWRFRRMSGKMLVNMEPTENPDSTATAKPAQPASTETSKKESDNKGKSTKSSTPRRSEIKSSPSTLDKRTSTEKLNDGARRLNQQPKQGVKRNSEAKISEGAGRMQMQKVEKVQRISEKAE